MTNEETWYVRGIVGKPEMQYSESARGNRWKANCFMERTHVGPWGERQVARYFKYTLKFLKARGRKKRKCPATCSRVRTVTQCAG